MAIERAITIVVPAYNEIERLPATLDGLLSDSSEFAERIREVVVSDDGSTDGTVAMAAGHGDARVRVVESSTNRGKGAALRAGAAAARSPIVVFLDADLPVPMSTIEAMSTQLESRPSLDLLVGSRRMPGASFEQPQPLLRRLGGRLFIEASHAMGYRTTSDPQCGVKVLRSDRLRDVLDAVTSSRFSFDIELIVRARNAGLVVDEFPVRWKHVPGSSLRPVRDAARTLAELLRLRRTLRVARGGTDVRRPPS